MLEKSRHVIRLFEPQRQKYALVVVGGEDQVVVTVDGVAVVLRLMAGDQNIGADFFGEHGGGGGAHVPAPDQLIYRRRCAADNPARSAGGRKS